MESVGLNRFWLDRPTLVTGATGLVGGWLVKRLLALKADVVCIVRDWVPSSELVRSDSLEEAKVVRGDVRDQAEFERVIGEYEIDTVFHLAAQTIVGIANRNPISTFETNIQGTWALLEACRHSPTVKQIVVASSDKAYGEQKSLPYSEHMPLQGTHPYDVSKSCADLIANTYAITYRLPVCVTRCGNFYGGGDLNWNRVVPGTIRSIVRGEPPVIRSDGKSVRDYIYVEDAAAAYTLLAERMSEDRSICGHAFNFSNESPMAVLDLVTRIMRLGNVESQPRILDVASNEIREQYLEASKARDMLGWRPLFQMDEGLNRTIHWYHDFFGVSR